jgi:hypothetical protein
MRSLLRREGIRMRGGAASSFSARVGELSVAQWLATVNLYASPQPEREQKDDEPRGATIILASTRAVEVKLLRKREHV